MSKQNNDLYSLINPETRVSYEFTQRDDGNYTVIRVWLSDNEREYMGFYPLVQARNYWNALVNDGFVRA